ncbi:MAG: epoxide hydrolase N-terminal domain-containing protein [Planctomycetota bacterium]|nr:epoxide hydrolase N-terminal domain-containing protein [Planctomycetota bacterium]
MPHIEPMKIAVPQPVLDDLRQRLERTRWPAEVPETGWSRGVDLKYMKDLVAYWL